MPATIWSLCFGLITANVRGDVPLPERVLNPRTPAEAWNVLRLVMDNAGRLVEEQRADEITAQIVLCSPALRLLAQHGVAPDRGREAGNFGAEAFILVNLVARESMAGNQEAAANALIKLRANLDALARQAGIDWKSQEIFACPSHPQSASEEPGLGCSECLRQLAPRRIPYSFIYVKPGPPVLRVAARIQEPLKPGAACSVSVNLHHPDGRPAGVDDLLVEHAAPVHLLLVDPAWRDFQHLTAEASDEAGRFQAEFVPAADGDYRLWTGVVPVVTALQEFHAATLPGAGARSAVQTGPGEAVTSVEVAGFRFHLSFHQAAQARANRVQLMRLNVTEAATGQPVTRLEPFMNAFAHVTGIYSDRETVLQLHPAGGDILREDLRGGPHLAFKCYLPRPGFLRLFCEVKIDGKRLVAPLAVEVAE